MKYPGCVALAGLIDETFLNELTHFPIKIFKSGSVEKQLKEPILIEVVFENEQYVVSNEEFGLFVVAPTLKSAIGEIQDELAVLWAEYVDIEESTLTDGAKQFRKKLLEIVK